MSGTGDIVEKAQARNFRSHDEPLLRAVMDAADDGIILIDAHGGILRFNPACEQLFGYRSEEVIGKNVKCLMPAPHREEHDRYLDRCRRGGERRIIRTGREVVGRRKDATTFAMGLSVGEAKDSGKSIFVCIIHDLSQSKDAGAKYRGLLEAAPDAIVVVNQSGEIVLVNFRPRSNSAIAATNCSGRRSRTSFRRALPNV